MKTPLTRALEFLNDREFVRRHNRTHLSRSMLGILADTERGTPSVYADALRDDSGKSTFVHYTFDLMAKMNLQLGVDVSGPFVSFMDYIFRGVNGVTFAPIALMYELVERELDSIITQNEFNKLLGKHGASLTSDTVEWETIYTAEEAQRDLGCVASPIEMWFDPTNIDNTIEPSSFFKIRTNTRGVKIKIRHNGVTHDTEEYGEVVILSNNVVFGVCPRIAIPVSTTKLEFIREEANVSPAVFLNALAIACIETPSAAISDMQLMQWGDRLNELREKAYSCATK